MDLGNVLLWTVITLLCVGPFIVLARTSKKNKQQSSQALQAFAAQHNASVDQQDYWFKSAIGIDEKNGLLFFISELHGPQIKQCISLADVQKCSVQDSIRMIDGQKVVDRIELLLSARNGNQSSVVLDFFNVTSGNLTPTIEFQMAEKWSKIVNAHLLY